MCDGTMREGKQLGGRMKQKTALCCNVTRCIVMNARLFLSSLMLTSTKTFFRNICLFLPGYIPIFGGRGSPVVKVLRYKSEGRWFDSGRCHWNFSLIYSFRVE